MSFLLSRAKMRSNSSGMSRTAFIASAILASSYHSLWKYNGIAYASTESNCFQKRILVCSWTCSFADIYRVWHGLASQTTLVEDSGCNGILKHILYVVICNLTSFKTEKMCKYFDNLADGSFCLVKYARPKTINDHKTLLAWVTLPATNTSIVNHWLDPRQHGEK